jgi:hypothetical protein
MHGLRQVPGSCQVEVSFGMLVLVGIFIWDFCGGNGIPAEGTEPWRKSMIYFDTKGLSFIFGKTFCLCSNLAQAFVFFAA